MTKAKMTQKEAPQAAGNTPAAGASTGGNVPTADAEKGTPTAEVPETEDAAEAQAAAEVATAKTEIVPIFTMCKDVVIVVCGTAEALPLLSKAWKQKAAPAVILAREVGETPFPELITGLMAEEDIPDTFILVPENCFPTAAVSIADLTAYRVRKFDDGHKAHSTSRSCSKRRPYSKRWNFSTAPPTSPRRSFSRNTTALPTLEKWPRRSACRSVTP